MACRQPACILQQNILLMSSEREETKYVKRQGIKWNNKNSVDSNNRFIQTNQ